MNRNDFSRYKALPEGIIIDTETNSEVKHYAGSEYILCELYDDSGEPHRIPFHRAVAMFMDPEWNEDCVVHHKDFNKFNNELSNLQCMTKKEHATLHGKARKWNDSYDLSKLIDHIDLSHPAMNAKEVAEYFNVKDTTVWRWVRKGLLPVHKLGPKCYRFTKGDIAAFERTCETVQDTKR